MRTDGCGGDGGWVEDQAARPGRQPPVVSVVSVLTAVRVTERQGRGRLPGGARSHNGVGWGRGGSRPSGRLGLCSRAREGGGREGVQRPAVGRGRKLRRIRDPICVTLPRSLHCRQRAGCSAGPVHRAVRHREGQRGTATRPAHCPPRLLTFCWFW